MPFISVLYSPNLEGQFEPQIIANSLAKAAHDLGVFPAWGVRVFVSRAEAASVAEADDEPGYVQVSVRMAPGRDLQLQTQITESLFGVLENQLGTLKGRTIGFAIDLSEFNRETYRSGGNLAGSPTR